MKITNDAMNFKANKMSQMQAGYVERELKKAKNVDIWILKLLTVLLMQMVFIILIQAHFKEIALQSLLMQISFLICL